MLPGDHEDRIDVCIMGVSAGLLQLFHHLKDNQTIFNVNSMMDTNIILWGNKAQRYKKYILSLNIYFLSDVCFLLCNLYTYLEQIQH